MVTPHSGVRDWCTRNPLLQSTPRASTHSRVFPSSHYTLPPSSSTECLVIPADSIAPSSVHEGQTRLGLDHCNDGNSLSVEYSDDDIVHRKPLILSTLLSNYLKDASSVSVGVDPTEKAVLVSNLTTRPKNYSRMHKPVTAVNGNSQIKFLV